MHILPIAIAVGGHGLVGILITFLAMIVVLAVIAGLIWAIETWIIKAPLPAMIRLVIGLILILLVVIWALQQFGGG